jgi:hypothetical protein
VLNGFRSIHVRFSELRTHPVTPERLAYINQLSVTAHTLAMQCYVIVIKFTIAATETLGF